MLIVAGIYIHIPFCKQKCHYCNFYSSASKKYRNVFIDALIKEIDHRKDYLSSEKIKSVYFGGGTPSVLTESEINRVYRALQQSFIINPESEITIEVNPDDLSADYLNLLYNQTPVNRLSIGVQSFFDEDLMYLNRVHNGDQAIKSIELSLKAGFKNITIDLIYGIPTLSIRTWKKNLEWFFSFDLPHLSSYSLTVEPNTALNVLINKEKIQAPDEEQSILHFQTLLNETRKHHYVHYEISNFAKSGYYSKHNSIYWLGGHYAGFGPSAHSFNGISRQWNVARMKQYVEADKIENVIQEKEVLTPDQQYNEYVMTSIRTSWGCDTEHIRNAFGEKYSSHFIEKVQVFIAEAKVRQEKTRYFLSRQGKLFADAISSSLFY